MIVLKATQDKVLAALQAVAGIIERRHTPHIFFEAFRNCCKSLAAIFNAGPEHLGPLRMLQLRKPAQKSNNAHARAQLGFFGPAKVNARNAP